MAMPPSSPRPATTLVEGLVPDVGPLATGLSDELERVAILVQRPHGSVLFDVGNPCKAFLLLEAGIVRVSRTGPKGREMLLYRVRRGETCILTLSCLLSQAEYPARGVVEHPIHGMLLPSSLFVRLTDEVPAFRKFIYQSFAERLAGLLDLASAVTFDRLDQRLAVALLERSQLTGHRELALTHQQLAGEIGTVRERVSRLLESFEAQGAVELGRGRVIIRDGAALQQIASRAD